MHQRAERGKSVKAQSGNDANVANGVVCGRSAFGSIKAIAARLVSGSRVMSADDRKWVVLRLSALVLD